MLSVGSSLDEWAESADASVEEVLGMIVRCPSLEWRHNTCVREPLGART